MPYFDRVERFCFFIAPDRSGHSIVAHLLCVHPDILTSDELNALSYFQEGYSASQIYALIRFQDARAQRRSRKKSGYDYSVEGTAQSDGKKHPLVIGDAKGAASTRLLISDSTLIDRLRTEVRVPLRVVIHVRHPFDIMATRIRRKQMSVRDAVDAFIETSHQIEDAADRLQDDEKIFQTHEELIADPQGKFEKLFRFLGVEPTPEIVTACANKIWRAPHLTRKSIRWQKGEQERLVETMVNSRFFAHYFASQ